jgi:16S rRNA pseudouridine516 synthase
MIRLDKLISEKLNISRSEAKQLIKKGEVLVNSSPASSPETKIGEGDEITVSGKRISSEKFVYIMMNKPKGVICASEDEKEKTVIDLLPEDMRIKNLFPAGRLDKDTTGFVLITNDGEFAHNILSPKKHVEKTYLALLDKPLDKSVIMDFESGMSLGEEKLLPAKLTAENKDKTLARVVIKQGIYHQIKRMFIKHGIEVLELKRIKIGSLPLDEALAKGESRYITKKELTLSLGTVPNDRVV